MGIFSESGFRRFGGIRLVAVTTWSKDGLNMEA